MLTKFGTNSGDFTWWSNFELIQVESHTITYPGSVVPLAMFLNVSKPKLSLSDLTNLSILLTNFKNCYGNWVDLVEPQQRRNNTERKNTSVQLLASPENIMMKSNVKKTLQRNKVVDLLLT